MASSGGLSARRFAYPFLMARVKSSVLVYFHRGVDPLLERLDSSAHGHRHHIGNGELVMAQTSNLGSQLGHFRASIPSLSSRTPVVTLPRSIGREGGKPLPKRILKGTLEIQTTRSAIPRYPPEGCVEDIPLRQSGKPRHPRPRKACRLDNGELSRSICTTAQSGLHG